MTKPCTCVRIYEQVKATIDRDKLDRDKQHKNASAVETETCAAHPPGSPEWEQMLAALAEPGVLVVQVPLDEIMRWIAEEVAPALENTPVPLEGILRALRENSDAARAVGDMLRAAITFRDAAAKVRAMAKEEEHE